jgi:hypothetical protein
MMPASQTKTSSSRLLYLHGAAKHPESKGQRAKSRMSPFPILGVRHLICLGVNPRDGFYITYILAKDQPVTVCA